MAKAKRYTSVSTTQTVRPMTKPIDLIHQAAIASAHPKLHEHVIIMRPELQHLLSSVTQAGAWRYMDVPCTAVTGVLNPQRGAPPEPFSWRQAALCLHGDGWGRGAIRYLEEPLRCLPMPEAPGAKRALKLTSYAGAVICSNGTHRLAAAIAWQLRPGAGGVLHMAATNERAERDGRVGAILAYAGDGGLEFVQLHAPAHLDQVANLAGAQCDLAIRQLGGSPESLLAFPTDGGPAIEVRPRSRLRRMLANSEANEARATRWFDWRPVPVELLSAWRGRQWLHGSLAGSEFVGDAEPHGSWMA